MAEENPLDEEKVAEEAKLLGASVMSLLESNKLLIEAVARLVNLTNCKDEEVDYKLKKAYHLYSTGNKGLKKIKFFDAQETLQ